MSTRELEKKKERRRQKAQKKELRKESALCAPEEDARGAQKFVTNLGLVDVQYCATSHIGSKPNNEDYFVAHFFTGGEEVSDKHYPRDQKTQRNTSSWRTEEGVVLGLFACFDGHGGCYVSSYLRLNFIKEFSRQMYETREIVCEERRKRRAQSSDEETSEEEGLPTRDACDHSHCLPSIRHIISRTIIQLDNNICGDDARGAQFQGSTVVCGVLTSRGFYVSNVGDSRCISWWDSKTKSKKKKYNSPSVRRKKSNEAGSLENEDDGEDCSDMDRSSSDDEGYDATASEALSFERGEKKKKMDIHSEVKVVYPLSVDHTPELCSERNRVHIAGGLCLSSGGKRKKRRREQMRAEGMIVEDESEDLGTWRVYYGRRGGLSMTRAVGDQFYKNGNFLRHTLQPPQPCCPSLIARPKELPLATPRSNLARSLSPVAPVFASSELTFGDTSPFYTTTTTIATTTRASAIKRNKTTTHQAADKSLVVAEPWHRHVRFVPEVHSDVVMVQGKKEDLSGSDSWLSNSDTWLSKLWEVAGMGISEKEKPIAQDGGMPELL